MNTDMRFQQGGEPLQRAVFGLPTGTGAELAENHGLASKLPRAEVQGDLQEDLNLAAAADRRQDTVHQGCVPLRFVEDLK